VTRSMRPAVSHNPVFADLSMPYDGSIVKNQLAPACDRCRERCGGADERYAQPEYQDRLSRTGSRGPSETRIRCSDDRVAGRASVRPIQPYVPPLDDLRARRVTIGSRSLPSGVAEALTPPLTRLGPRRGCRTNPRSVRAV
jgi:hypothetical protein